ncbi:hypothetical protein [Pedobacter sp. UYP1]|uniref:hypothetical protein n=1 Tax=Pedobacter sp. UYP1 TaxID=1756396 RepID=UPI003398381C
MKHKILIYSVLIASTLITQQSHAQFFKKIQQKIQDKVDKKVDDVINGNTGTNTKTSSTSSSQTGNSGSKLPNIEEVYSFTPASNVFFADNFSSDPAGRMASHWKTSGTGSVTTISDVPGKWLALSPRTTYRLENLLAMPGNFTIEFDLITRSTEVKDIGAMQFGFAKDNSNREYISDAYNSNAITESQLHFWNKEVNNSSSDTKISNQLSFPLNNYANALIHVAIAVEGENMRVYINKSKVVDTRMFKKGTIKYFYLSAPFDYSSDAMVYFGNLVMAKAI